MSERLATTRVGLLRRVAEHAFARNGPAHRVLGEFRPPQLTSAVELASFIDEHAADGARIPVSIQEQQGGIGKTAAIGVVLFADALLNGRREIVSTFRRDLRRSYIEASVEFNEIVRLTFEEMRMGEQFRNVRIEEYRSTAAFISPSKVAALRARLTDGSVDDAHLPLLRRFIDFFDHYGGEEFLLEFSQWYDEPSVEGLLPLGYAELDLALCVSDRGHPVLEQSQIQKLEALEEADVLLVTHAMLMRNSIGRGRVLKTHLEEEDRRIFRDVGALVIDEADKLITVSREMLTFSITLGLIEEILESAVHLKPATPRGREMLSQGLAGLERGLPTLRGLRDRYEDRRVRAFGVFTHDDLVAISARRALEHIESGLWNIRQIVKGEYASDDQDVVLADQIRLALEELRVIVAMDRYDRALMVPATVSDPTGKFDLRVSVNMGSGRSLISQLWRQGEDGPMHQFGVVAMLSAALTDRPPNTETYNHFCRLIGADDELDDIHRKGPLFPAEPIWGRIAHVIVPERDTALRPTDPKDRFMLAEPWVEFVAKAILVAAGRQKEQPPATRMLVLFHSHAALNAVLALTQDLAERIVTLERRDRLSAIQDFAERDWGIWYGLEWEGANFVDAHGRTLVDILVITRIPQPPTDLVRARRVQDMLGDVEGRTRSGSSVAIHEAVGISYRRMRQAICRGIRKADDVIKELYILDIRFPVPDRLCVTGDIIKSDGDPMKLFSKFDHMLEQYRPQRWSVMMKDGGILRIE